MVAAEQTTLPIPENFKFDWEAPEDAARYWLVDLMHWPHGLSPLAATMDLPPFIRGFDRAAQELRMPVRAVRFKVMNSYVYSSIDPWSLDPAEFEQRLNEMKAQMATHGNGLLERWRTEYEPEIRSLNDETIHFDYSQLGDRELSDFLERLVEKREREGLLHFLSVLPAMGGVAFFEEVYTNLFGPPQGAEHLQLLQGFPNKSVEAGDALWYLSQEARRRPAVMNVLKTAPEASAHESLPSVEGGAAFREAVTEYTDKYGWRANEFDMAEATWYEDPTPVYRLVREYAAREDYDPEADFKSLVAAREARESALLDKLAGGPVELFRQALAFAQQYTPVQEDHNFWIDQQGTCVKRLPALEAGRRLAATGRIDDANDVFYLRYDDLQDALRSPNGDLRELVTRARMEREHFRTIAPPPELGTPPPPEAAAQENPTFVKFMGKPPEQNPDPRIINGNGASAGSFTGTARVIMSLEDAGRLKTGEILVCPATMPPWTPLFAIASAVVTDHGGVLSHTAIVAREYRIPAVVGTKLATALVQDGQTITIDGAAGTVKLEA
jgi:pyruvate,water dikinase